jgi:hypothetical protein
MAVLALLVAACSAATAQEKKEKRSIPIALQVGAFFPSSSTTRDRFGSTWFNIGVGIFNRPRPNQTQFIADVSILHNSDVGSATLIPVTFGVQRGIGNHPESQPYVAARVGPYYGKVHGSRLPVEDDTIGFNGNVAAGVVFKRRFSLEVRYDYYSRFARTRFDGLTVQAGIRVFDIKL